MMDKRENSQISNILRDSSATQSSSFSAPAKAGIDASLQVSYDSLIEQASQAPQEDAGAIERARQLMASGQIDSLENIQQAAEAMIKFGV